MQTAHHSHDLLVSNKFYPIVTGYLVQYYISKTEKIVVSSGFGVFWKL
jgi:hypothetical protein